jgi:hypothetical protein
VLLSQFHEGLIYCDANQPGRELRVFPEVIHILEGLQEGLLDRVLGVFAIVRDVFRYSQEFAIVSPHELLESRYISILGGMDEIQISPYYCLPREL